ncbi:MAG: redox-sensing transcriptional repressor Rex [Candidatus Omnitrophica bacterium]|nr:redox-sensing transcriptional repressor Rex [Candidatus Omnitrophota bacterium]MDD5352514.1 redox-sensing transcriptional repressor Rex [Candidatus Omnitrophota bacterium]MDD5550112.1 redox-sensing transcriptional repressor Rex [Candidatus Omnitrophota bacterium]
MSQSSNKKKIPKNTITRLSLYLRELTRLEQEGKKAISSSELAELTDLTDTQVRKDLSYFGQFGISGTGYEVSPLKEEIKNILGKGKVLDVILIGAGNLGSALLSYSGFKIQGFNIKAAFDIDTRKIGQKIADVPIHDIEKIQDFLKKEKLKIAILAVSAFSAQKITDTLVNCGIKYILNFAPLILKVPDDVMVSNVDLSRELEIFSYFIKSSE